ncbi:MAG TPA: hypothetical protein VKE93_18565 [Candidatus Angelobacter sp.]|nr:hypothetical protein [Candidatus Angelobacter sp.]
MNKLCVLLPLLSSPLSIHALQASTPQAALEEIATTDKPDVLVRHLPEPVQKSIEVLTSSQKQQVLDKLLSMKTERLDGCTLRHASDVDAWEIIDPKGESKGTVKLVNTFFSGVEALLSLKFESEDGWQMFIVAMHLEGDDWRIDNFGPWENTDLGLRKLVHQPTEAEKNDSAALATLNEIVRALSIYAQRFPRVGFPAQLHVLTGNSGEERTEEHAGLLDPSFAAEPLTKGGYEFRYTLTRRGEAQYLAGDLFAGDAGEFRLTARPVEYGKTGFRSYTVSGAYQGGVHATAENREATEEDPAPDDPD